MAAERKKEKPNTADEKVEEKAEAAAKGGKATDKQDAKPRRGAQRKPAEGKAKQAAPSAKAKSKPKAESEGKAGAEAAAETEKAADAPKAEKPVRRRAPARRRGARERPASGGPGESERRAPVRPVVRAQAKYVRSSARKTRLVVDHIRGKSVEDARAILRHTQRGVARDLEKLLASAVANAENNHELVGDDLMVKEAFADEGPTLKRFRPRALGRATRIRKRTSHVTVTLTPKE
jgi:ribosomal protein L22